MNDDPKKIFIDNAWFAFATKCGTAAGIFLVCTRTNIFVQDHLNGS